MTDSQPAHLRRTLGLVPLVVFGLSYMAVATVFTTYGIVNQLTEGHLVLSYLVAVVVMLFTASSYGAMVRKFPVAGSAYTYTQQSFGGVVGFLTGWILMLDYLFIPMINFMILGLYMGTQFPSVPNWIFMLACLLAVLLFNVLGISLVNKVNITIIAITVGVIAVFAFLAIKTAVNDPNAPGLLDPFIPGAEGFSPVFAGAAVLALSFLGFDAVSTLSEEAKNARKDIPRAIILTTLIGGAVFIVISWLGARAYYLDDWSTASEDLINAPGVVLAGHVGGEALVVAFLVMVVIGCFGSGLAGQVAVSRIIYAMGRDGILPKPFSFIWAKFGTPVVAAVTVSIFALSSMFLSLDQAAFMISFGALGAFAMVNLSVIKVYLFPKGEQRPPGAGPLIRYGLIPLIGVGLTLWLWTSLQPLTWVVGGIWLLIGVIILLIKTHFFRRPVPVLDFSEGPTTEAIDALGDDVPFEGGTPADDPVR
ncbi:MAG: APC family permease [Microbacterium sp.]|uniref:APC family permease n=1 Tax=Microbacterium sp. TaxID=51671 RepID=UPI0039E31FB4